MHTLIENLKDLSNLILLAKKQNDYNKIIEIDNDRRIIIDQIFSKGIKTLSEADINIIASAIVNMSKFAFVREIKEAEINPIIVKKENEGIVAVDGLITLY